MQRAEVWWADLPQPAGRHPVLLLSRNAAYKIRTSLTVAVITRTIRNIPVEVSLGHQDGLPQKCVVNLDNIITIPVTVLLERISTLSPDKMVEVAKAIVFALDLDL
jgi:mRNA interferase MazF